MASDEDKRKERERLFYRSESGWTFGQGRGEERPSFCHLLNLAEHSVTIGHQNHLEIFLCSIQLGAIEHRRMELSFHVVANAVEALIFLYIISAQIRYFVFKQLRSKLVGKQIYKVSLTVKKYYASMRFPDSFGKNTTM